MKVICRKSNLEELSLATPTPVPESAFFGDAEDTPIFLRLTKLKKLTLDSSYNSSNRTETQLERMPTDRMLINLLSKMSLTHLTISGRGWNDVTSKGIRDLVEGPFGQSILFTELEALEGTSSDTEKPEALETLERVCHANRVASGLTSNTFQQFKASEEVIVSQEYPFRSRGWSQRKPHFDL